MNPALKSIVVAAIVSTTAFAQSAPESLAQAQQHFRECKAGKLQLEFVPALKQLEAARKSLEKGRRETETARRALEGTRKRIEAGHQVRHASVAEREAKEAHYAQTLSAQYVEPMKALEPLNASYREGIKGYAAILEKYATFCAQPGLTTASSRAFVSTLEPAIAALSTDAQSFVASASKAAEGDVAAR